MRLAKVIGVVTTGVKSPHVIGGRFLLCQVRTHADLTSGDANLATGEQLVAFDDQGAGVGQLVALSEGGEATQPFRPKLMPIDCYIAALIDQVRLEV